MFDDVTSHCAFPALSNVMKSNHYNLLKYYTLVQEYVIFIQ